MPSRFTQAASGGISGRTLGLLAALIVLAGSAAFATPVRATVNFPQGLPVNQTVPVTVMLAPGESGEGAQRDFDRLKGSQMELVLAGGQNGVNTQYTLGKIGGDLKANVKVQGRDRYLVGLRFVNGGKNYGTTVEVPVPLQSRTLEMEFQGPSSEKRLPLPQLFLWAVGSAVLALLA
jgi:hypothetical protein